MGRVLFAGGRLETVKTTAGVPADVASYFEAAYSDASLELNSGRAVEHLLYDAAMAPASITAGHVAFFHCYWHLQQDTFHTATDYVWRFLDSAGYAWLRAAYDPGGGITVYAQLTAGVWTALGATIAVGEILEPLDFVVMIDAGGSHNATLYRAGTATVAGGNFAAVSFTNIAKVQYQGANAFYPANISQLLVTEDISTIGANVKTSRATGAGAHSDWTGAYTDVNEAADNDTTQNKSSVAGQSQSYPMGNLTVPGAHSIASIFYWLRAKNDIGTPANVKALIKSAAIEVVSANLPGVGIGYGAIGARYDTDPNTGLAWTQAGFNAPVQLGFVSAT